MPGPEVPAEFGGKAEGVSATLYPYQIAVLREYADKHGLNMSGALRAAVDRGFEKEVNRERRKNKNAKGANRRTG